MMLYSAWYLPQPLSGAAAPDSRHEVFVETWWRDEDVER